MSKQSLVILGGGHAGSSAALAAARHLYELDKADSVQITLIDQAGFLTIRPRLYEYELETMQVSLTQFLAPLNVDVVKACVSAVDLDNQQVAYQVGSKSQSIAYDVLVMALGSQLVNPKIPGIETTYNIDTYREAYRFREDLRQFLSADNTLCRIAILGGGITGLELATELPVTISKIVQGENLASPKLEIAVIDRNVVARNISPNVEAEVTAALSLAGVKTIDHASITRIEAGAVCYNEHSVLPADFTVSTLGLRANPLATELSLDTDQFGRLYVNTYMQVESKPNVFVAGDMAFARPHPEYDPVMSCQQGRPQGRYAGFNAVSYLYAQSFNAYSQPNYVTCVDLGAYGAIFTKGWDRQLVHTGAEAKAIKQHINQDRIYPPKSTDIASLLEAGAIEYVAPTSLIQVKEKR